MVWTLRAPRLQEYFDQLSQACDALYPSIPTNVTATSNETYKCALAHWTTSFNLWRNGADCTENNKTTATNVAVDHSKCLFTTLTGELVHTEDQAL